MQASEFVTAKALSETAQSEHLTQREKHLIGLAVTTTRGCQACTGRRINDALEAGIDYATVRATIDLTAAVNAGVVLRTAIEGAARENIQSPKCDGDECSAT